MRRVASCLWRCIPLQTQSSKAESPLSPQQAKGLAMRVSLVSVAVNLVLSAGKLLAGVFAHSGP